MKLLLLPLVLLLGATAPTPPRIELEGYISCQASLLEQTGDALGCYARTQRECQNGNVVLAFQKRLSKRGEKPVYEITDTIHVKVARPGRSLAIASCTTAHGQTRQYFVLFKEDATGKEQLHNISRAWGVNAQNQLVAVPAKALTCLNGDYGAD